VAVLQPRKPWNGVVKVTEVERQTIGFKIAPVVPQTQPIRLELNGTTDYDQNTLNRIRTRFDNALVEKVFVSAGQSVKKGDPLLELKSADLAAAKNECRTKYVQWDHDHKYLVAREPLAKEGRITQIVWTDTVNDEKKSRLDYLVARDKLATYGMTHDQIEKLLEGLSDDRKKALEADDDTQDISRMTLISPVDGVVVERDVVPGNFYDNKDNLLTISPMDELWVWGNVFESDQDKVHIGQKWDIRFQFSKETFEARVESIANGVDPDTRTLRIRATIPNGSNLRLLPAVKDVNDLPTEGANLVVVAEVDHKLHFRTFDDEGEILVDTDEARLADKSRQIEELKKQLAGIWPPHEPTGSERARIISAITSIVGQPAPNPGKNLKARMLVRAILQIDPLPGDTMIPRNALSVINGEYYAFVQRGATGPEADLFERRKLEIEQETIDAVIVKKGLKAGERVVSNGSLILSQMYEDQSTVETGLPVQ